MHSTGIFAVVPIAMGQRKVFPALTALKRAEGKLRLSASFAGHWRPV